jgi:DNA-binding NtrC family response regulator
MVSCLLIEPNAHERAHVKNLLELLGMECVAAPQAEAMLNTPTQDKHDVIVMEASSLPDAKRYLRQSGGPASATKKKPVVIMYGRETGLDVINESIIHGVSEFLVQPFDLDLLRFKLKQSGVLPKKAA